jgi:hypothetical protein
MIPSENCEDSIAKPTNADKTIYKPDKVVAELGPDNCLAL